MILEHWAARIPLSGGTDTGRRRCSRKVALSTRVVFCCSRLMPVSWRETKVAGWWEREKEREQGEQLENWGYLAVRRSEGGQTLDGPLGNSQARFPSPAAHTPATPSRCSTHANSVLPADQTTTAHSTGLPASLPRPRKGAASSNVRPEPATLLCDRNPQLNNTMNPVPGEHTAHRATT